jgi:hypothetical protein
LASPSGPNSGQASAGAEGGEKKIIIVIYDRPTTTNGWVADVIIKRNTAENRIVAKTDRVQVEMNKNSAIKSLSKRTRPSRRDRMINQQVQRRLKHTNDAFSDSKVRGSVIGLRLMVTLDLCQIRFYAPWSRAGRTCRLYGPCTRRRGAGGARARRRRSTGRAPRDALLSSRISTVDIAVLNLFSL